MPPTDTTGIIYGRSTAVLKLSGPFMAWGLDANWETRPTLPRPTKSGVLGMVANAMGRDRADEITDLLTLRFSVRADRPGHLVQDDQTAGGGYFPPMAADFAVDPVLANKPHTWMYGVPRGPQRLPDGRLVAPWKPTDRGTVMLSKTYIADAAFLCGLTGDSDLVDEVAEALENPQRLLYLGRRSCVLDSPPLHAIVEEPDWEEHVPLLAEATTARPRFWYETTPGAGRFSPELPERFDRHNHRGTFIADTRVAPPREGGERFP